MARLAFLTAAASLLFGTSAIYVTTDGNDTIVAPCDSPIYCYGELLKEVELARPFADSKTFVDLPTIRPVSEVIEAFNALPKPLSNDSVLQDFLSTYFGEAGSEIEPVPISELEVNPTFLDRVNSSVVADFAREVVDIWPDLTRRYVGPPSDCSGCADSLLPINGTFVVAGGRFREVYYWDTYWIIEGLLRTQGSYIAIAKNIIENFMGFVRTYGFVPNGGRLYYLNRSQPPLLTQMVARYLEFTNDTAFLEEALPVLELEWQFWEMNRTSTFETPAGHVRLSQYRVNNTEPRPESFREDYETANNESYYAESRIIYPATPLSEGEKEQLYANLASGAESGWDYSSRWIANPENSVEDNYFPLRSLNTYNIIPVDLNSILYYNEITIAGFYNRSGNASAAAQWESRANARSDAMYRLMWNSTLLSYFDFNMTSMEQERFTILDETDTEKEDTVAPEGQKLYFSPAHYYPFWTGAAPDFIKNNPFLVQQAYQRVRDIVDNTEGGIAATNLITGQQWDEPNVWPPLQYIMMKGLLNTPATFGEEDPAWQFSQDLALDIAQRYVDSTFCTWRATGGALAGSPRIENTTGDGIIFEKYNDQTVSQPGGGGEYQVVEGFGWSNGALLWAVDTFADRLVAPDCGNITAAAPATPAKRSLLGKRSAVELDPWDAQWIKSTRK